MPRQVAPRPSGEFSVRVAKPFNGTPNHVIEVIGEPNRPSQITRSNESNGTTLSKTGQMAADDVQELLRLVNELRGFPSHATTDVYGYDTVLELHTFEIQWSNKETDPTSDAISEVAAESKDTFKRVIDSIESAASQFAKNDSAV